MSALDGVLDRARREDVLALIDLLDGSTSSVRTAALMALVSLSDRRCVPHIARLLHDGSAEIASAAERALGCLWLRDAGCAAARRLREGIACVNNGDLPCALDTFDRLVRDFPEYAEAHNQRGIVLSLQDAHGRALESYQRAYNIESLHFWALAGAGNCYAALGRLDCALECHGRALAVNPRFELSADAMRQLMPRRRTHVRGLSV